MATWEKCSYCGKNLNGYNALTTHKNREHPGKLELEKATQNLQYATKRLATAQKDQAEYETLEDILQVQVLPVFVTDILTKEREKRLEKRWDYRAKNYNVVPFTERIAEAEAQVAKARANLEALSEPTPQKAAQA